MQPAFECSISIENAIQKILTKLQTKFQCEERNYEKNVIIFLKNVFNIKLLPYPSILSLGIGSQVAIFIGIIWNKFWS